MLRQLCVVAGLSALGGLGAFCGSRVAEAACESKCREVVYFHTKTHAADLTGSHHKMVTGPCIRIWWTPDFDDVYAGIMGTLKKYKRVLAGTCSNQCFANGGVWAESICENEILDTTEVNIVCYNECRPNPPGPPGM